MKAKTAMCPARMLRNVHVCGALGSYLVMRWSEMQMPIPKIHVLLESPGPTADV
jgi:hypothetical protein